ncbi:type IV pilus secretin PilQ [Pelagibacterales bacterium SAG-MED39]|nr:type IV pilus secretin PilQ [Pelagibacterales bacterium SAG-MED39]
MKLNFFNIVLLLLFSLLVTNCSSTNKKSVHGDKPLIDPAQIVVDGTEEMQKKVIFGPKPYETEFDPTANKRKTITTEQVRNYVSISNEYEMLKQNININLNGVDFRDAMDSLAEIGGINIIVGEEVSGTLTAKLENVGWDVAFQTLLDMKTLGADIDVARGIIRVHTPEKLTAQETLKSTRAEVLKKKIQLEDTVEPILADIFRLYYISPSEAKATLENLFKSQGPEGTSTLSTIQITEENMTRSIIVRGRKPDLDVIDAVLKEIDVKTQQVLIEAFIVTATSDFQKALGSRVGAMTKKGTSGEKGSEIISGTIGGTATVGSGISLGAAAGTVTNNSITGATSGIGIIKTFGTAALKLELEALQSLGKTKIISSPSVFTLNNQEAKITQGTQIAYTVTSDGTTSTEFKDAALSLTATPSIIGDGNVLLDILVNNDTPVEVAGSDEPGITKREIDTKLLVSDGDIVVIGGIKINTDTSSNTSTPGLGNVPVLGNLFKGKNNQNKLEEMLIFLAPRVIN